MVDYASRLFAASRGCSDLQEVPGFFTKSVDLSVAAAKDEREVLKLSADWIEHQYGDLPLVQSAYQTNRQWASIGSLDASKADSEVWIRARLATVRAKGKAAFMLFRTGVYTLQGTLFADEKTPKEMIKFVGKITPESIVDVFGKIVKSPASVEGASQKDVELQVRKIYVVSSSMKVLPLQIADAMLPEPASDDDEDEDSTVVIDEKGERPRVKRKVRLDNRWMDWGTPCNHAIFRIQSRISGLFKDFFHNRNFVEVHTPKIIAGASEGGAEVFRLKYFGRDACLAQSPQLYKQMCICSDLHGVYEIGPVFRAENSNTNRHLTEFVGLDFEMEIKEHYHEVLDTLWDLFCYIFDGLNSQCKDELQAVNSQYPFDPLKYTRDKLVIHFHDAIEMLRAAGIAAEHFEDLSTPQEKALGKLVKQKYGVDFYIVDQYPMAARPFYTMPNPDDPRYSNSYDVFLRGEEITSGAQRVHDPDLLVDRAINSSKPIPLDTIKSYIDSFRCGAPPHGGAGIGLERVTMLFLGLPNIRKSSLFPRDPKRVTP